MMKITLEDFKSSLYKERRALAKLAEVAPDVCEQVAPIIFKIRIQEKDAIYARNIYCDEYNSTSAIEDAAWLQLALKRAIEYKSWFYEMSFWSYDNKPRYRVRISNTNVVVVDDNSEAAALLAAFIEALEGER